MIEAVTLEFCSIQKHFIRALRAKLSIPNFSQSPDIWQKPDRDISNFRISGQSLIKGNRHNSRTSDNIGIKLEPVTKLYKRNKRTSKKFDDDVMSESCNVIAMFRN